MENLAIAGVPCIPRDNYFLGIILARGTAAYGRDRLNFRSVDFCNISQVLHGREPCFSDLDWERFDFRCP